MSEWDSKKGREGGYGWIKHKNSKKTPGCALCCRYGDWGKKDKGGRGGWRITCKKLGRKDEGAVLCGGKVLGVLEGGIIRKKQHECIKKKQRDGGGGRRLSGELTPIRKVLIDLTNQKGEKGGANLFKMKCTEKKGRGGEASDCTEDFS